MVEKGGVTKWDTEGFLEDIRELEGTELNRKKGTAMSFLDISQSVVDAKPEHCVAEGEYKLRVIQVKADTEKGYMFVRYEFVDDPYARDCSDIFNLPGAGRNEREENRNILKLTAFYKCFGMDPMKPGGYAIDEAEPTGMLNREGWVLLSGPQDDGKGYGEQNKVKYNGYMPRR